MSNEDLDGAKDCPKLSYNIIYNHEDTLPT